MIGHFLQTGVRQGGDTAVFGWGGDIRSYVKGFRGVKWVRLRGDGRGSGKRHGFLVVRY